MPDIFFLKKKLNFPLFTLYKCHLYFPLCLVQISHDDVALKKMMQHMNRI